jgi:RimJ/RimL family protein N-acetyltransferase
MQRWHVRRFDSDQEAHAWVTSWPQRWQEETAASWAIARADGNEAVGQVGFRGMRLDEARAQISYWLAPEVRGRGLATRAASTVTEWALSEVGFQRVGLGHAVANTASCRVAELAGFALEGTLRRYGLHADGWHDMHMHARTALNPWITG